MSEQIEQIDVKQIMQELREEIKRKGYTSGELSFKDVAVEDYHEEKSFNIDDLSCHIGEATASRQVDFYRPVTGNAVKRFIKKVIRRIIGIVLEPVALDQEQYNVSMVSSMSLVYSYICEKEDEIDELKLRIEELEKQIDKIIR